MSANVATASDFGIPAPDSIEGVSLEFKPVSIKHLGISLSCDCCWYNSSTPGCGKIIDA